MLSLSSIRQIDEATRAHPCRSPLVAMVCENREQELITGKKQGIEKMTQKGRPRKTDRGMDKKETGS